MIPEFREWLSETWTGIRWARGFTWTRVHAAVYLYEVEPGEDIRQVSMDDLATRAREFHSVLCAVETPREEDFLVDSEETPGEDIDCKRCLRILRKRWLAAAAGKPMSTFEAVPSAKGSESPLPLGERARVRVLEWMISN